MRFSKFLLLSAFSVLLVSACKKDDPSSTEAQLQFKFKFDPAQERLNNIGLPAGVPAGHAAQSPDFKGMSVHYIELAPGAFTQLGQGAVIYKAPETTAGGDNAIDFSKAVVADEGEVFTKVSLKNVPPGTYEWVRASVAYQTYDVRYNINNIPLIGNLNDQSGRVASFLGFNTYIGSVKVKDKTLTVNDDKKQGFWGFETSFTPPYDIYNDLFSGEAPAGATTVVNPINSSSPIPPGSCVVTGKFLTPLVVTGNETGDVTVTLSFSINKSFEWVDTNGNGKLDIYADGTTPPEQIVDMGLRGLIPSWAN